MRPVKIYISFSHKDKKLKDRLVTRLVQLHRQGLISVWDDEQIDPGQEWHLEIRNRILSSDLILVLVSEHSLASEHLYYVEMPLFLERRSRDGTRVIPVILRPCNWQETPLASLKPLPDNAKPLTEWSNRAKAYMNVFEGIKKAVYEMRNSVPRPRVLEENADTTSEERREMPKKPKSGTTLIIHGHAEQDRYELKDFLQDRLQLPEPVVMASKMIPGQTLPNKFESLAGEVELAIALLTPDDEVRPKSSDDAPYQSRARQNTLIEIGWFWGRLGLGKVLLLVKGHVEIPTDLQGLEYQSYTKSPLECSEKIRAFYEAHGVLLGR